MESGSNRPEFEELKDDEEEVRVSVGWWHWGSRLRSRYNLRRKTARQVEKHLIEKLPNLLPAGRFILLWTILVSLVFVLLLFQLRALTPYYTGLRPAAGGVYVEGLVGRVTNFNPIYANSGADRSVSRLVFANLFDYGSQGRLRPVLAESLSVDEKSQQYVVKLRPGLRWHDGQPLTADDVVFTVETIQNADAGSPLRVDWEGVSVAKIDELSLKFTLEASFSPFVANLVLPVLPEHLLAPIGARQLRSDPFGLQPVGSGPFVFERLTPLAGAGLDKREFRVQLRRNPDWPAAGGRAAPLLDGLHFWVVPAAGRLTELFNQGQITGAFNLVEADIGLDNSDYRVVDLNLMNGVYLFFKNSSPLLAEAAMRRALASALEPAALLAELEDSHQRIFGPLLPEHAGYALESRPPAHDPEAARLLLGELGWQNRDGGWFKEDRRLSFILTTQKDTPYETLARAIRDQLAELAIEVSLDLRAAETVPLEILQQHNYGDMLIYGLELGGDADIYSYWHSSQIDSHSVLRLNLSEYRSEAADEALEIARSRSQTDIRRRRYADFQRVWMEDLPALALYRFQLRYYTLGDADGPRSGQPLVSPSDRFLEVENWAVVKERRLLGR